VQSCGKAERSRAALSLLPGGQGKNFAELARGTRSTHLLRKHIDHVANPRLQDLGSMLGRDIQIGIAGESASFGKVAFVAEPE
jgi:hypothetical protein